MLRLLTLALLLVAAPALAEERITRFVSEVEVMRDASLLVEEEITVEAEGNVIQRGIFRDFPTLYTDRRGRRVRVGLEVLEVLRDGRAEPYRLEPIGNGTRIRIGDPDVLLPHGRHRYTISYRTDRQLGFFPEFDELYWNVTGNDWVFPISEAVAVIRLPDEAPILQRAFYTGLQGASGQAARVVEERPGLISFRTTAPLAPQEGLTVAVAWPKGHVEPPGRTQELAWTVRDNAAALLAGIGPVLLLGYYLFAWVRVGRDPAGGTVIPLFTPPEGMSAPGLRYARQMGFDHQTFATGILSLAVKGWLRIKDDADGYTVERRGEGQPLTPAERSLHDALFASGPALKLHRRNHRQVRTAQKALRRGLESELPDPLFRTNTPWFAAGVVLSGLLLLGTFLLLPVELEENKIAGSGLFAGGAAGFLLGLALRRAGEWWRSRRLGTFLRFLIQLLIFLTVAGFGLLVLAWAGLWVLLPTALLAPVLVALGMVFYHLLKAPTPRGRRVLDQIEGFKRYLEVAEEDRLGVLHPPERTPELFERYLPYALALGVEHEWSRKFADVLAGAAVQPEWYAGRSWNASQPSRFAERVGSSLAAATASAGSAPGSRSGSGGGGSSGGGGGGGGGGGW